MCAQIVDSFRKSVFEVRDDLVASTEAAWESLGKVGTWLTGGERLDIVREVRQAALCQFCAECRAALSPYSVEGSHRAATDLNEVIVDVVHRVVTSPSRLSEAWFQGVLGMGLGEGEYAEIVGTIVTVVAVERLLGALDLPMPELPEAQPGYPVRREPSGAKKKFAWLRTVSTRDASEQLRRTWFGDGPPGFVPRVRQALSLAPDVLGDFIPLSEAMYIPSRELALATWSRPGLTRRESELVATRTAAYNDCYY